MRRFNLIQGLKDRGWKVVALDLGDIAQRHGPQSLPNVQGLIKYRYSMMALKAMDYSAVGLGENEIGLPLFHTLGEYALQYPRPRVLAANLINKNDEFPGDTKDYADHKPSLVGDWQIEAKGGLKVGIIGLVGPSVARQTHNQSVKFADNNSILPAVLKDLNTNGKPDMRVLLYQGTMDEGKACAQKYPDFQVILCLSEEDEPSAEPKRVGNTFVIGVGHKGKYVGVVGVNRPAKADQPFDLRYQLMALDPEFETPANQVQNHPVMKLMEEYTKELKKEQYLQRFVLGNHPLQVAYPGSAYVGSEACQKCHNNEHAIWKASPHAHAYKQLVNAKNPFAAGIRRRVRRLSRRWLRLQNRLHGQGDASGQRRLRELPRPIQLARRRSQECSSARSAKPLEKTAGRTQRRQAHCSHRSVLPEMPRHRE